MKKNMESVGYRAERMKEFANKIKSFYKYNEHLISHPPPKERRAEAFQEMQEDRDRVHAIFSTLPDKIKDFNCKEAKKMMYATGYFFEGELDKLWPIGIKDTQKKIDRLRQRAKKLPRKTMKLKEFLLYNKKYNIVENV